MAILACLYGWIAQGSIWYPVNLLAAVVIPSLSEARIEQLRAFNGLAFGAASGRPRLISILVGVLYAVTLPMFPRRAPTLGRLDCSAVLDRTRGRDSAIYESCADARINWIWFVICQIAFGLVAGLSRLRLSASTRCRVGRLSTGQLLRLNFAARMTRNDESFAHRGRYRGWVLVFRSDVAGRKARLYYRT